MLTVFEVIDEKRTHRGGKKKKMRELFFLCCLCAPLYNRERRSEKVKKKERDTRGLGGGENDAEGNLRSEGKQARPLSLGFSSLFFFFF